MSRWKPFPIVGGAYADDTRPWSVQDTVNYLPVSAERGGTRSPSLLKSAPGFTAFCDLGTGLPIRGAHNAEGLFLVVSGNSLFSVSPKGVATNLGTIPGVGRVSMAHNQITGGNQIAIANGLGGYVYDTTKSTLTQITDEGFVGAIDFDYVDSYIVGVEPGKRFWFTSDLADATSYNTLDRYEAEGSPDKIMGLIVTHREVWVMGERTIEPFQNTGAAEGTFQRAAGMVMERGLASTFAMALLDNSVFWLGDDGVVYRANGYQPMRISTFPIEQAISRCNMSLAFAFTFDDQGHKVFYLTFPDGQTWGFDVASSEWHRRQSYGYQRWRLNTLTKWNGGWYGGDFTNGKIYKIDWNVQHEDGAILEKRRVSSVVHDNQNRVIMDGIQLVVDTGQPRAIMAPPTPTPPDLPWLLVNDVLLQAGVNVPSPDTNILDKAAGILAIVPESVTPELIARIKISLETTGELHDTGSGLNITIFYGFTPFDADPNQTFIYQAFGMDAAWVQTKTFVFQVNAESTVLTVQSGGKYPAQYQTAVALLSDSGLPDSINVKVLDENGVVKGEQSLDKKVSSGSYSAYGKDIPASLDDDDLTAFAVDHPLMGGLTLGQTYYIEVTAA